MHINTLQHILDFFQKYEYFVCIGHVDPDGDCVSSALVLQSLLKRIEKKAYVCMAESPAKPEIIPFRSQITDHIPEHVKQKQYCAIILDCSTIDRIGSISKEIQEKDTAVIDHHSSGRPFGAVRYIDDTAPSVTYLIMLLAEKMNLNLSPKEAELLLFGLSTDTGFFRHLTETSSEVLHAAAKLVKAGASPRKVHQMMYGNRTLDSRKVLGKILQKTESHYNGKLLVATELLEDKSAFPEYQRDSDMLYQLLQTVRNTRAIVLFREAEENTFVIGLRSRDNIDIGAVATQLGGGGHVNAAGATVKGSLKEVRGSVLNLLEPIFK